MKGQLFVISAPSGAGKTTIVEALRRRYQDLAYSISHTTRLPRKGEMDGKDYHFVSRDVFEKMIEEGHFLEWAEVYGNLYGTSFSTLEEKLASGSDILLDLDTQGGKNIRSRFPNSVLIFLLPPSLEILENRLRKRATDSEEVIGRRMREAVCDIRNCTWYDYLIINDDLEAAIRETVAVILSERCRGAQASRCSKTLPSDPLID
ncbi:MAG TPA: guanylate kinase, partial [Deltaproteobacteria bacterium]|nr:guanylate kinase [Deltaproteobacteria bacterium]